MFDKRIKQRSLLSLAAEAVLRKATSYMKATRASVGRAGEVAVLCSAGGCTIIQPFRKQPNSSED